MSIKGSPQQGSSSSTVGGVTLEDLQRIPTHFLTKGVVESVSGQLEVTERAAGANMTVDVAAGLCLVEITTTILATNQTVKTWLNNSATVSVSVPTADGTYERIDRIIAKFDTATDPDGTLGNNVSIELVEGTPAGSPSAPATPSNAISLATISVPASDTTISDAQITDDRSFIQLESTVLQDVARQADLITTQDDAPTWLGTITGTDTLTGSATPTRTAYSTGMRFAFRVANDNTGAVTLNIDSIGAKDLKGPDGATLAAGDIKNGGLVECRYDSGLDDFVMTSPKHSGAEATITVLQSTSSNSNQAGASSTSEVDVNQYQTIAANEMQVGDVYEIEAEGFVRSEGTTSTLRLKIGSTTIASLTLPSMGGDYDMRLNGRFTVRSIGASGTVMASLNWQSSVASSPILLDANNSTVTIDTTSSLDFKVSHQSGSSDSRSGTRFHQCTFKKLRP